MMGNIRFIIVVLLFAGAKHICGNDSGKKNDQEPFLEISFRFFNQVMATLRISKVVCSHPKKDAVLVRWKTYELLVAQRHQSALSPGWLYWGKNIECLVK